MVDPAAELRDVAFSTADEPVTIRQSASVSRGLVQAGGVGGAANVRDSALLEHSSVDVHAAVEYDSWPNTAVFKGEVAIRWCLCWAASSEFADRRWPEGKGNVAYGAMVGANHTGRAPDQAVAGEAVSSV